MSELDDLRADVDQSGVFTVAPMVNARRMIAEWTRLQPDATRRPVETRAFSAEVTEALERAMDRLVACEAATTAGVRAETASLYELLDATYVLERLDWCVLHIVPYVDRPRSDD